MPSRIAASGVVAAGVVDDDQLERLRCVLDQRGAASIASAPPPYTTISTEMAGESLQGSLPARAEL